MIKPGARMSTSAEFAQASEIYALNYRRSRGEADVDRMRSQLFIFSVT
jgi:hypothetical protein